MSDNAIKFSDTETPDEVDYRSISPWAIVSLVLGLTSLAALASPKLWLLPAVAVAISLVAIRSIRKSAGTLTGEILPLVSLFVCLIILGFIPVRQLARHAILFNQARAFAEEYFQMLRDGRFREAYLLTKDASEREATLEKLQGPVPQIDRSNRPSSRAEMMDAMETLDSPHGQEQGFMSRPLMAEFKRNIGDNQLKVEFVDREEIAFQSPSTDVVVLRYQADYLNELGNREAKTFLIHLMRGSPSAQATANWRIGETVEAKAE